MDQQENLSEKPGEFPDPVTPDDLTTKNLFGMSILSLLLYTAVALLLVYFFHNGTFADLFRRGYSIPIQLIIGLASGLAAAGIILFLSVNTPIKEVLNDFAIFRVIARADFSNFDKLQVSLFAGIGEEILFRGALQPIVGIWFASAFFIAIHGYFKFKSAGHIHFGIMMFALSMMLGVLFETAGLVSAMTAHAVYDMLMLKNVDKLK